MKQFNQIIRRIPKYRSYRAASSSLKQSRKNWWTPIWKGLAMDEQGKHRKAMGASVWTYLYLLTFTNRATGVVRRNLKAMAGETGLPLRTVQRHLKRLIRNKYISYLPTEQNPQIKIEKWKSFNYPESDDHK